MTDTSTRNERDQDQVEQQLSVPEEHIVQDCRYQSFIARYGADEPHLTRIDRIKLYLRKQCASLSFLCLLNGFLDAIPLIRCLKEYNIRKNLLGDIAAGVTVAIMHIPQGKECKTKANCVFRNNAQGMKNESFGVFVKISLHFVSKPSLSFEKKEEVRITFERFHRFK